jgi:hypothetical protein
VTLVYIIDIEDDSRADTPSSNRDQPKSSIIEDPFISSLASLSTTAEHPCLFVSSVAEEPSTSPISPASLKPFTSAVIIDVDEIVDEASDVVCNVGLDIRVGVENDDCRDTEERQIA